MATWSPGRFFEHFSLAASLANLWLFGRAHFENPGG
jgi:hypothetical protein